ncbi:leucyl aminopeptidase [Amaricoccus solimangrovi]|uniref:Probable cytosol aminopeptidase n=1 Tax=Amaricoccus solimangrovi TaxID=2589815 RepID=A0A501WXI9_9RHOB|nr:leucyl aminopeptidase [Amaricoccus solimangrovi]TPE52965.1 leucyl aminopeptidase [Amaricoccus solimangrovi]
MTTPLQTAFVDVDQADIAKIDGRMVIFADETGTLPPLARKVDRLAKGAVSRLIAGAAFGKAKTGSAHALAFPAGLAAESLLVVKLPKKATQAEARVAGAAIAAFNASVPLHVLAGPLATAPEIALGLGLRAYAFDTYRKVEEDAPAPNGAVTFHVKDPAAVEAAFAPYAAQIAGVFFTRDLTWEPANVLTTTEFANRLTELRELGVEVEVLEEPELEELGMRTLLAVGQGSESPTKVVVMQWKGGEDEAPFALVGKGVVFDTGGISIKPSAGMEEMTMDMGGAGVVSGVMKTLATRKAKANVVGLVGLVENMPDGKATRPGDVVKSMKGDTIEIINTDAEGRLVLADVLWYAQQRFKPTGVINLATLTGAIIIALGHEKAGVFSNDDAFAGAFLAAAGVEGEGAWRMPLAPGYDKALKSRIADIANVGGRPAGAVTAAQFLQRFIVPGTPWAHLDIAGVAYVNKETDFAPKGSTGWGVRALDRLIRDRYEH